MPHPLFQLHLNFFMTEVGLWGRRNFGRTPKHPLTKTPMPYRMLLGACEELGELCHAHLKQEQGVRGTNEEHVANAKDAVGDIIIYLTDYCYRRGWSLGEIVDTTWESVQKRDWKKNPHTGVKK